MRNSWNGSPAQHLLHPYPPGEMEATFTPICPLKILAANLTLPSEAKKYLKEMWKERKYNDLPQKHKVLRLFFPSNSFLGRSQAWVQAHLKQTLVQWQLLLTSQGDQMAHLSTKEKEELLRAREEEKTKKRHENREAALFSQDTLPPQEFTALLLQTTVVWKTIKWRLTPSKAES